MIYILNQKISIEHIIIIILSLIVLLLMSIVSNKEKEVNVIYTDYLTGLNNMRYFNEKINQYIKRNNKVHLLLIDFRNLKHINDNYGHEEGDKCLVLFSNLIKKHITKSLLIRRSGDEFIIATSLNLEAIKKLLEIIQSDIEVISQERKMPASFKFNAGITSIKNHEELSTKLKEADIAMYEAKKKNKLYEVYKNSFTGDRRNQNRRDRRKN